MASYIDLQACIKLHLKPYHWCCQNLSDYASLCWRQSPFSLCCPPFCGLGNLLSMRIIFQRLAGIFRAQSARKLLRAGQQITDHLFCSDYNVFSTKYCQDDGWKRSSGNSADPTKESADDGPAKQLQRYLCLHQWANRYIYRQNVVVYTIVFYCVNLLVQVLVRPHLRASWARR